MMINNNAYISILPISTSGSRRAHISPEEKWNFTGENFQKLECFSITKIKARGDSFEEKSISISEQFC